MKPIILAIILIFSLSFVSATTISNDNSTFTGNVTFQNDVIWSGTAYGFLDWIYIQNAPIYNTTQVYNKTEIDTLISGVNITIYGNESSFDGWDKNASDDVVNFADLNNIPAGLSDGDDDTQLSEAQVDNYVSDNGYLTSYTESDPVWTAVSGNYYNKTQIDNFGYSTFDGLYTSLNFTGTTGLSDGVDNDTQLSEAQVDSYVSNNGYLTSISSNWTDNGTDLSTNHIVRAEAYATGDAMLSNEIDAYIGDGTLGALQIGGGQIFMNDFASGDSNTDGTLIFRNTATPTSPFEYLFLESNGDDVRFAIPRSGNNFATLNPRSMMIGGSMNQDINTSMINCSEQGYVDIDCMTGLTGADLGIEDDLELGGNIYMRSGDIYFNDSAGHFTNDTIVNALNELSETDNLIPFGLSTGIISGGTITINSSDNTKIDVTSGTSLFVNFTDPLNPVTEFLSFPAVTISGGMTSKTSRWVGVERTGDNTGQVVIKDDFTPEEDRTIATLGKIWGNGTSEIQGVGQYTDTSYGVGDKVDDLIDVLGSLNKEGNVYYSNNGNLQLSKTAGQSFRFNGNYPSNPLSPYETIDDEQLNISLYFYHTQNKTSLDFLSSIQPDYYDNNGVLTPVPAGNFTIQRIYFFSGSGITLVTYGQSLYNSIAEAEDGINTEDVSISNLVDGGILRGFLIVKDGTTNLSDTTKAKFITATSVTGTTGSVSAESDPIFKNSVAFDITATNITQWQQAYNWGDHALAGYSTFDGLYTSLNFTGTTGLSDGVDNDTQLSEAQVDNYVSNNGYVLGNQSAYTNSNVQFNNVTVSECFSLSNGAKFCEINSTCAGLYSPSGTSVLEICD